MAMAGFLIAVRPANATGAKAEGAKGHPSDGLSSEAQPARGQSRSFKFSATDRVRRVRGEKPIRGRGLTRLSPSFSFPESLGPREPPEADKG